MCTSIPRYPNNPTSKISNSQARKNYRDFDDYVFHILLIVVVILGLFVAYSSKMKTCHPKFQINYAAVANFSASLKRSTSVLDIQPAQFNATWDIDFLVTNPNNGLNLSFTPTIASVFYKHEFLESVTIPPFTTYQSNVTTMQIMLSVPGGISRLSDRNVLDIVEDWKQKLVRFDFRVMTMFYVGDDHRRVDRNGHALIVSCNDVMFQFEGYSKVGTLLGESIDCEAQVKWKWCRACKRQYVNLFNVFS